MVAGRFLRQRSRSRWREPQGRAWRADLRDQHAGGQVGWGEVREVEPGRRILLAWTLGLGGSPATEVEVVFADAGERCEVHFAHRGWGEGQHQLRAKFDDPHGWDVILGRYRAYAAG
ncbi:MAG TPA: SRPBCC domain-containing protein [Micromonosporaceae bacterium]